MGGLNSEGPQTIVLFETCLPPQVMLCPQLQMVLPDILCKRQQPLLSPGFSFPFCLFHQGSLLSKESTRVIFIHMAFNFTPIFNPN